MNFVLNAAKLPRSMTRKQWRECHRWSRIVGKAMVAGMKKSADELDMRVRNTLLYGTSHPELRR